MLCMRPRVLLTTKLGEIYLVSFHLYNRYTPSFFKWNNLKPGSTMYILYPKPHQFLDLSEGIRQENTGTIMVFPASQEMLTQEYCFVADDSPSLCFGCGQQKEQLKRCSKCKLACYCFRDFQASHGKILLRKLCKHYQMLLNRGNPSLTDLLTGTLPLKS